jgi:hypothetical protein
MVEPKSTLSRYWGYLLASLKEVLKKPAYLFGAVLFAVLILVVMILLPNHELVRITIGADFFTVGQKAKILWASLGALKTNFTAISRVAAILVALLAGINTALFIHYFKTQVVTQKAAGASLFGMIFGFLGIGCSACGSVILSSIFGIGAATGFLSILPFKGLEFSILSVSILLASVWYLAIRIQLPAKCKIKKSKTKDATTCGGGPFQQTDTHGEELIVEVI